MVIDLFCVVCSDNSCLSQARELVTTSERVAQQLNNATCLGLMWPLVSPAKKPGRQSRTETYKAAVIRVYFLASPRPLVTWRQSCQKRRRSSCWEMLDSALPAAATAEPAEEHSAAAVEPAEEPENKRGKKQQDVPQQVREWFLVWSKAQQQRHKMPNDSVFAGCCNTSARFLKELHADTPRKWQLGPAGPLHQDQEGPSCLLHS
eukprot:6471542-Amphidinium_carterae.1